MRNLAEVALLALVFEICWLLLAAAWLAYLPFFGVAVGSYRGARYVLKAARGHCYASEADHQVTPASASR